jgi:hypothetical protein
MMKRFSAWNHLADRFQKLKPEITSKLARVKFLASGVIALRNN